MSAAQPLVLPHDIIEPPAIDLWPLAPGWWLLLALAVVLLTLLARRYWRKWRQLAPLRQALTEHQQITQQWQQQGDARQTSAALSALIKRTARWRYPTVNVTALTGTAWQTFLVDTGSGAFDDNSAAQLMAFLKPVMPEGVSPPLLACQDWLHAQRTISSPEQQRHV